MKLYQKIVVFTGSLRTGLFVVCFLAAVLLSGCGSEDMMLSELRQEDTEGEAEFSGAEDTAATGEDAERGFSMKKLLGGGQSADAKEIQNIEKNIDAEIRNTSLAETGQNEQGAGVLNTQDAEQNGSTLNKDIQQETKDIQPEQEKIYVHVCGAVKHPGVYDLPVGSRFYEAVEAAGGFEEDACEDYLNMAAPLADGSRLEVPTSEEIKSLKEAEKSENPSGGEKKEKKYNYYTVQGENGSVADGESTVAAGSPGGSPSNGLVNINTADVTELCNLPGVGEGRAKAIIEYREKQGGFQKKEDIMQVSGIGEKMYARMEEYLAVE